MKFEYLFKRFVINLKNYGLINSLKKVVNIIFKKNKIDLDQLILNCPDNLDDIFIKFGTDKGSLDGKKTYDHLYKNSKKKIYENYLEWIKRPNPKNFEYQLGLNSAHIYEKVFSYRRFEKLKILEIGVANGHSIASWHHYFPNSEIYGIDNKKPYKFFYKSLRVKYHEIDVLNDKKINKFLKKNGKFDYIIDDSLHTLEAMFKNIKNFYPYLNSGGAYILEDYGFLDHEQKGMQELKDYNLKQNMRFFPESKTVKETLENMKSKKVFEDNILDTKTLENIYLTLNRIEFGSYEHPFATMAILYKK
tara:strand:+ start:151 stop:1065 length:915 start_codon:yes stop_codon:yes gene_type:complete